MRSNRSYVWRSVDMPSPDTIVGLREGYRPVDRRKYDLVAIRGHLRKQLSNERTLAQSSRNVRGERGEQCLIPVIVEESRAYGVEQLRRWSSLSGEVIPLVDVVYDEREEKYDMQAWVISVFDTS
ncbi:hypothetical protein JG688_00010239 [Phytophthora aleatoria]|uniref:Uncharacterized protein n=1 Tax=Phytophthora aleatoria TaxID=2496075 RepID=A0A8J5IF45_9STRA|nr:hypothetical protein JG688_00010239 [Phytophthora aleatoria]